ncbi:hypothetical protein D9M68_892970 [compost metagenome]
MRLRYCSPDRISEPVSHSASYIARLWPLNLLNLRSVDDGCKCSESFLQLAFDHHPITTPHLGCVMRRHPNRTDERMTFATELIQSQ